MCRYMGEVTISLPHLHYIKMREDCVKEETAIPSRLEEDEYGMRLNIFIFL